jgi:hypothetical protein
MLLKLRPVPLALWFCWLASAGAQAQSVSALVGVDAWDINAKASRASTQRLLFLADSTPQWTYRNPNAWVRFDSQWDVSEAVSARFKFRGDQSSDWRVDELNLDWAISPFLGLSAGVVDYKTSWCRTYDVESTWVRENDPFCTVRTTDQATGSAPGLQAYTQWDTRNHQWQAQVGVYNPLLLNHDRQEFNNQVLLYDSEVIENKKVGFSINAVNMVTSTEWRLGYLYTDQTANNRSSLAYERFKKPQQVQLWYLGVGFDLLPGLRARLTHLNSQLDSTFTDSFSPNFDYNRQYDRESSTAELQWNIDGVNRLGLAYSVYSADTDDFFQRKGSQPARTRLVDGTFKTTSWSASWRRDWTRNAYTALQWTQADTGVDWRVTGRAPDLSQASGHGLGMRLGWRY